MIQGNVLSTNMLRSDYAETDPGKAGFILNKPEVAIAAARAAAEDARKVADEALPRSGGTVTGSLYLPDPEDSAQAATKGYVDARHLTFTLTLAAEGWAGDEPPYTQELPLEGILETDTPHFGPLYQGEQDVQLAQKEAYAVVDDLQTFDGTVTFSCFGEKPSVDICIQMEVNR